MWTCNSCKQNFPSLTGISAQLKSIEDTTYKRLIKLEDDVHDMKTGLVEKIRGEVKTIKPSLIEEIKQDIKSTLQDDVRMVVREIEDQNKKSYELIFFNVPKSEDKNNIARNEYDHSLMLSGARLWCESFVGACSIVP
jgi:gas vesicle protein